MADQPQTPAVDELIRGILRSVDPTDPGNADEFGKIALAALEKVSKEANEVAETHLPQVANTLVDTVTRMTAVTQAILTFREGIAKMSATERFNAARVAHATAQNVVKMCDEQRINARNVQLEVDRHISLLTSTRTAVGEFITTGCGIMSSQTGTEPPPDSYAARLSSRIWELQKAFTLAAAIQKTLNNRKKTLASGLDLLGDISIGIVAADVDFLKYMNPIEPNAAVEPQAEPRPGVSEVAPETTTIASDSEVETHTPIQPVTPVAGIPDAAQLADIILGAQAKAANTETRPATSTALMVIPRQPEPAN